MTVKVSPEVLRATANALDNVASEVPDLFARASGLDVSAEMSGLSGADTWAADTAADLTQRRELLESLNGQDPEFAGQPLTPELAELLATQQMTVEEAYALATFSETEHGPGSIQEWLEQEQAVLLNELFGMDNVELAERIVQAYHDVMDAGRGGSASVAAFTQLISRGGLNIVHAVVQSGAYNPVLANLAATNPRYANWLHSARNAVNSNWLNGKLQWKFPGSFIPNLAQGLTLRLAQHTSNFDSWVANAARQVQPYAVEGSRRPTALARLLNSGPGQAATGWVSRTLSSGVPGAIANRLAPLGAGVFGRPWTNPATGVTYGRGAGNLITMARQSGAVEMARNAGGLRVLGAVGSGALAVDNVVGLWNNREAHGEAWASGNTSERAGVVADYAEAGFNASMTAAMIAPNPVTLGAVAVTGVVWAGAKVVENWDDITDAAGRAKDWVGDRASDVKDWAGDRLNDVKESKINPMNWF